MNFFPRVQFCCLLLFTSALSQFPALASQFSSDDAGALRAALEARSDATLEAQAAQRAAESRQAILEAERAALLAQLPPALARPQAGSVDTRQFGAGGLVRAFDLARELAAEVCTALPLDARVTVFDPATSQGIIAARTVNDALNRLADELARRNKELQLYIDTHTPPGAVLGTMSAALTVVPALLRASADSAALFKGDVTAAGLAYGEGARTLFVSALAETCPARIAGLGGGYLGELDLAQHERLLGRLRSLANHRADYANRIAQLQRLAEVAKGEDKKEFTALANSATAVLKTVDSFIESLKAGETGERSPLYNAARHLGYAARTEGTLVLDFDLRLEGMSITRDNLFTGQKLRLSSIALLWYRLHAPDGSLLGARTLRRVAAPLEVDLRGTPAPGWFWNGQAPAR